MSTEANKAVVRRFYSAFEANDRVAMLEVLSPDLVAYTHGAPGPQTREEMLDGVAGWNAAFGDTHFDIELQIAEADLVATVINFRSTHSRGAFMGVQPAGKQVATRGDVSIERIKDGKIVERRVLGDFKALMEQLGAASQSQAAH